MTQIIVYIFLKIIKALEVVFCVGKALFLNIY